MSFKNMSNRLKRIYGWVILINAILFVANSHAEQYVEPNAKVLEQQNKMVQDAFKKLETPTAKKEIDEALSTEKSAFNSMTVSDANNAIKLPDAKALNLNEWKNLESSGHTAQSRIEKNGQREKYPIIFVSFSMPEQQIKALIEEAPHYGAVVVIRGLINDDFKTTISKLQQIAGTQENASGILIDPTLFKMFGISTVPSFVIPLAEFDACTQETCMPPQYVKVAGSATLAYVLDLVSRTGSPQEKKESNYWLSQKNAK